MRWLVDSAGPGARDSAGRRATQEAYDASLRPLAAIFWKVHAKLEREPDCFKRERDLYAAAITGRRLPERYYERWFFFMNPEFCPRAARGLVSDPMRDRYFYDHGFDGGVDGNVVKTVVGFWLRRSIDGTRDTFAEGLKRLITAYDPAQLASADAVSPSPPSLVQLPPPASRPPKGPRPPRTQGELADPFAGR